MKTFLPKKPLDTERDWFIVDANEQPVGRLAVKIADVLRGKNKPDFTPHIDTGAFVIVVNAEKVKLSGSKEDKKIYPFYSGYRGGLKEYTASALRKKHPELIVKLAVKRMLPKNRSSRTIFSRLKVYAGSEHPHTAQKPQVLA